MGRPRKTPTIESIQTERAALAARLAQLDEEETKAKDQARDAGRATLLSALEKVKIPGMTRDQAKTIATAFATLGADALAARLSASEN